MTTSVRDNAERSRFEVLVDGEVGGFADYRLRGDTIVFTHAEVDDSLEGQGLGSALARESLQAARDAGLAVIPACPFYADHLRRHPDDAELVPVDRREEFGLQGRPR